MAKKRKKSKPPAHVRHDRDPGRVRVGVDLSEAGPLFRLTYDLERLAQRLSDPQTGSAIDAPAEIRAIIDRATKP